MIRHPRDKAESKYNPDVGVSKEDEERYQKLVNENEELQRLITQVSTYTNNIYKAVQDYRFKLAVVKELLNIINSNI